MDFFRKAKDIGIDFGTANTEVYLQGKGIILREPSVVAINDKTKGIVAVGEKAKAMIGKTPRNISTINPIKSGAIANIDMTQDMIKWFNKRILEKRSGVKRIIVCCPAGVTEVEKSAIEGITSEYATRDVSLIDESLAAAIGLGLPINKAIGNMIVIIGAGVTEISVISLDEIVKSTSLRIGGDKLDEAIINYMKNKYKLKIGKITAENIKIQLGSVIKVNDEDSTMSIKGMDIKSGMPKAILITESEIRNVLEEIVGNIIYAIKDTLSRTPPELSSDIIDNGIIIAGGGALLAGLDKKIHEETNIDVKIAEEPLDCVAMGIGKVLEHKYKYKKYTN